MNESGVSGTVSCTRVFDAHGFIFRIESPIDEVVALFDDLLVDMVAASAEASPADAPPVHRFDIRPADPTNGTGDISSSQASDTETETDLLVVLLDGEAIYPTLRAGNLTSHLLMEVNRRATQSSTRSGFVPLHAASVSGVDGTVLFPGTSHSGKTTVATAMAVKFGDRVRFVADEVSALDPADLSIARYGKPVALRAASVELLSADVARLRAPAGRFQHDERFVPPSALGGASRAGSGEASKTMPLPVAAVVFPRFGQRTQPAGPGDAQLTPLSRGATLERLMQSVLGEGAISAATFNELARVAASAPGYELNYEHLPDVLGELAALI